MRDILVPSARLTNTWLTTIDTDYTRQLANPGPHAVSVEYTGLRCRPVRRRGKRV